MQLEKFRLLLAVTRGEQPEFEFKIRNVGTKSIIRYTVSYRTSLSTGGTLGGGQSLTKPILPGEIVSGFQKNFQVVPLSDEIRVRIGLDKKEQMLVVLMVEKVVFDDGSSFDAAVTSQAFFDYFLEKTKF